MKGGTERFCLGLMMSWSDGESLLRYVEELDVSFVRCAVIRIVPLRG